jgi:hypothetical protein
MLTPTTVTAVTYTSRLHAQTSYVPVVCEHLQTVTTSSPNVQALSATAAAIGNDTKAIDELLQHGVDINAVVDQVGTVFHSCVLHCAANRQTCCSLEGQLCWTLGEHAHCCNETRRCNSVGTACCRMLSTDSSLLEGNCKG